MTTTTHRPQDLADAVHGALGGDGPADRAAARAERVIDHSRRAAHDALDALHQGVDDLGQGVPDALHRAASQVDDLTRRSIEQARATARQVRQQVQHAGDRTVGYIRDEPVKSMLFAAAVGAVVAGLAAWMSRSSRA